MEFCNDFDPPRSLNFLLLCKMSLSLTVKTLCPNLTKPLLILLPVL